MGVGPKAFRGHCSTDCLNCCGSYCKHATLLIEKLEAEALAFQEYKAKHQPAAIHQAVVMDEIVEAMRDFRHIPAEWPDEGFSTVPTLQRIQDFEKTCDRFIREYDDEAINTERDL